MTGGLFAEAVRGGVFSEPSRPAIAGAAQDLVAAADGEVAGIVFFGSRRTAAAKADAWSAHDFFVVVRAYRPFYAALRRAGKTGKSPGLMACLNVVLPPNQVSLRLGEVHAKCSVLSLEAFRRETSARRKDHFCIGRLFQPSQVLHAADAETERILLDGLVSAHALTYRWVRPWLPAQFDAATYCRTALRVSLRGEIRPEPEGRAEALWAAQREEQTAVYGPLLAELAAQGELRAVEAGVFSLVRPVGRDEALALRAYFARSLVRATVRWAKHILTFEGWLDYILRKVARHEGEEIVLTPRERRLPYVFLWPRFIRYLRAKRRDRGAER